MLEDVAGVELSNASSVAEVVDEEHRVAPVEADENMQDEDQEREGVRRTRREREPDRCRNPGALFGRKIKSTN